MAKSSGALVGINMLVRDVVVVVAGSGMSTIKERILTRKEVRCKCMPAEIGENIFSESKNW